MIRYMKINNLEWYARSGNRELFICWDALRVMTKMPADGCEKTTKSEFLAFVDKHHDLITQRFVRDWIADQTPKPLDCEISQVAFVFDRSGSVKLGCDDEFRFKFRLEAQSTIVDLLTENLKRHSEM